MNIIVPDGYTLNPGDLSWSGVEAFGSVRVFERTALHEMAERCKDADVIVTNKAPVTAEVIDKAMQLKLICVTATGYNIVDLEAARKKGVVVCNVPGYGTASVAQHTFALILELANRVGANSAAVSQGEWVSCPDFSFSKGSISELKGKTLGIVGLGEIGDQVARLAQAFEMGVLYNNRNRKQTNLATYVDLNVLFQESDIISLHCPLTKENQAFVNKDLLSLVKKTAWLINTSRGQLIQEQDLADALMKGDIGAAALDVLSSEPPPRTNPLLTAKNCLITPHTAWISMEARRRVLLATEKNIAQFLKREPVNVVG